MGGATDLPLWIDYVAALAPAAALLVATTAALIAWRSHVRQKRADRHQHLWTSLTWALDQLEDPKDAYKTQLGMTVLTSLGENPLINRVDNQLLGEVNKIVAARSTSEADTVASEKEAVAEIWGELGPHGKLDH